jgi:tripartite-type tricarboxylate transporter receptor subunit TctC
VIGRKFIPTLVAVLTSCGLAPTVKASTASTFYSGKTLFIIASSDPGGGYDSYTRLLGRYIPKYIPGAPTVVVENEPGGGGLRVAQDIYAVAQKDGTKIANLRASTLLDSALGIRGAEINPTNYEWIGNMASDTDLCSYWYTAGVHSFADLRRKTILVGSSGKGAQNWSFTNAINRVLHTKMKIIVGYNGMADRVLALQRGELQGNCGINSSSMTSEYPQLLASGKIIPIMQSGLRPYSALPNVPLTQSFAANEHDKRVLVAIFSQMDIARIFAAPPGTPQDRVELLRRAFDKAMKDPGLIAEAKKERLDLNPMSGSVVARVVARMSDLPPDLRGDVRAAVGD